MADDDNIFEALLAVQEAVPTLPKDKTGQFQNRYTSLDKAVEIIGPKLREHGLLWFTKPTGTHDEPALHYELVHAASGQKIMGVMPLLLEKATAQGFGSAITYARRYALIAIVDAVGDDDDDGKEASRYGRQRATPTERDIARAEVVAQEQALIDEPGEEDAKRIKALLKKNGITTKPKAAELFRQLFGREPTGASFVASLRRNEAGVVIARLEQGALPTGESDVPADAGEFDQPKLAEGEVPWEHDGVTPS